MAETQQFTGPLVRLVGGPLDGALVNADGSLGQYTLSQAVNVYRGAERGKYTVQSDGTATWTPDNEPPEPALFCEIPDMEC